MYRLTLLLVLVAHAAACSPDGRGPAVPDSAGLRAAAATITPGDMYDRIAFLAHDSLRGRDTPSPGLETAAAWIASEMAAFGLEPGGEDGWFQRYPFPAEGLDRARTILAATAGATHSFEYGSDYFAWDGADVPPSTRGVFARTLTPGDLDLLRGRALITVLNGLPDPSPSGLELGEAARRSVREVREAARAAGAAAVLFVLDRRVTPGEVGALAEAAEESRRTLGGVASTERPIPAFFLRRPAAERVLRMAGLVPEPVLESASDPRLLEGLTFNLEAPVRVVDDARPPNVVGVLRGSDPALRSTYVVLSAHMDHVGVGRPDETGDSIYNGADDDASGTSVLVEVAEAMARLEPRPRRSILFLAVSGEEKGLLGSAWYSEHPTVPLDSIVANINIDMVGRNAPDSIVVIGQEYSSLGPLVLREARRHSSDLGLTVARDLWPEQRFFFRSDHYNFARKEIPALFFFAGVHEDYHRPSDEVERVDTDKTARVGRLVFYLTHAVASDDDPPAWDRQGLETVRRLTTQ